MLRNVEYANPPARYVYEPRNGIAYLTLADNIHEGKNANGDMCWLCDLYFMDLDDSPNMAERVERAFDKFLSKAKAVDAQENCKAEKPDPYTRIAELEAKIEALTAKYERLSESAAEVIKVDDSEMPRGDYLNPVPYERGMNVFSGLFYTDGENIWEALVNGIPDGFDDRTCFDIVG